MSYRGGFGGGRGSGGDDAAATMMVESANVGKIIGKARNRSSKPESILISVRGPHLKLI